MNVSYAFEYKEAWNSQDFNRVWTCDLVYWCDTLTNWAMKLQTLGAGNKSYIDMNQSVENEQYVSPTIQDVYTPLLGSKVWKSHAYDVNGIFFLTILLTLL